MPPLKDTEDGGASAGCLCLWGFCQDAAPGFEALIFLACFLLISIICKLPSTDSLFLVAGTVISLYLSVFNEKDFCVSFSSVLLFESYSIN